MHRFALILIALILLMQPTCGIAQRAIELDVYSEWRGDNCRYESVRPFFIIRDLYDLENFWQKANAAEAMPDIDFEKCMLLVWAPGPTMFDYRPAVVDRFVYQNGYYFVVMDFKRKDTGGFWRRPFVATLLPSKTGDIFIMRKEIKGSRIEWKPLYTIWDMTGERTRPFEVAKVATPPEPDKFIAHDKGSSATKTAESGAKPASSQVAGANAQPVTASGQQAKAGQTAAKPATMEENLFGSTPARAETKAQPVAQTKQPSFPTFEEDPLFGTEFDIEF